MHDVIDKIKGEAKSVEEYVRAGEDKVVEAVVASATEETDTTDYGEDTPGEETSEGGEGEPITNFPIHNGVGASTFWVGEDEPGTGWENQKNAWGRGWVREYYGNSLVAGSKDLIKNQNMPKYFYIDNGFPGHND